MKKISVFLFSLLFSLISFSQTYVYVSASSLNLRSENSTTSEVLDRLTRYDNLIVSDTLAGDRIEVMIGQQKGYVHSDYVKDGKAKASTIRGGRIGAICKGGTSSSATDPGACSHHGGVSYWRHSERQSVQIIPNSQ